MLYIFLKLGQFFRFFSETQKPKVFLSCVLKKPHTNKLKRGELFKMCINKSCQKTTTLAGRQQSLDRSNFKVFSKVGQTSRSRPQGQKLWHHVKGLVISNTHMQYESPITSGKKVMAKVKFVQK